jgi:ATP/maltotriose-dependent transcriptional regulator MalT
VTPTDWALAMEARVRALLAEGDTADGHNRDSIAHLRQTRVRVELARGHLLHGEWLRRERRRADARAQLRTAFELLSSMGAVDFADRARRELQATGETVRKRTVPTHGELTPQEAQIARLARDRVSNPEIGARLPVIGGQLFSAGGDRRFVRGLGWSRGLLVPGRTMERYADSRGAGLLC